MCPSTQSQSQRPLRADARRNREAILKAARAVFSARGREGHLEEVARRAKVGMGTVYRHFPTKEALLEALAREQFDLLTELGARGAGGARSRAPRSRRCCGGAPSSRPTIAR